MTLDGELQALLDDVRRRRGFDPPHYLAAKTDLINGYLSAHGLAACVVGVSGGVDSAVVLGLLASAAARPGSPIRRIVPLLLPIHGRGATGQDGATARGREVCAAFGVQPATADLTAGRDAVKSAVDSGVGAAGDGWATGQLVSYLRTPALYYAASLLAAQGLPAVVVGTTNRDEGAYLGYFGKASDAMVDVQPIADLHKSEVYALAGELGVPASARQSPPTGDTFDGRPDEEVFGASYDVVELYLAQLCGAVALPERFAKFTEGLDALHRHNAHKYLARSPAVHLDVLDAPVPGGWRYGTWPQ